MNTPPRILIVDDEPLTRHFERMLLEKLGYEVLESDCGETATKIANYNIDLIVLDVMMPDISGFEVVRRLRIRPETMDVPIVICTALSERAERLHATDVGANDFIAKPIDPDELRIRVKSLLKLKAAQDDLKQHHKELEATVEKRTVELRAALVETSSARRETYQAYLDTIKRLVTAAEYKDKITSSHIQRMSRYSEIIAESFGLSRSECEAIRLSSPMHDVGKIGIPDHILLKPSALTTEEWEIMKTHSAIGGRILEGAQSELLQMGRIVALSHHEWFDGSGYPAGISGEAIPLFGRIVAVADVFDALTNQRQYKEAWTNDVAYEMMMSKRGNHLDPVLVDLFLDRKSEIEKIQAEFNDESVLSDAFY